VRAREGAHHKIVGNDFGRRVSRRPGGVRAREARITKSSGMILDAAYRGAPEGCAPGKRGSQNRRE